MAQLLSTQIQLDTKVCYFEDELKQISIYIDKDVQERKDIKQITENLYERIIITEEHLERDVKGSEENINKLSERLSATEVQMHETFDNLHNLQQHPDLQFTRMETIFQESEKEQKDCAKDVRSMCNQIKDSISKNKERKEALEIASEIFQDVKRDFDSLRIKLGYFL